MERETWSALAGRLAVALGCLVAALALGVSSGAASTGGHGRLVSAWTLSRAVKAPRTLARVVRPGSGDGEVELRAGDHWGAPMPLTVNGGQLNIVAVSCASASFCGAISASEAPDGRPELRGENFAFVLVNGTWVPSDQIDGEFLGIDCPTVGTCVTLDDDHEGGAPLFTDGAWTTARGALPYIGASHYTWTLSCTGEDFCVAASGYARSYVLDGTRWEPGLAPDPVTRDLYRNQRIDAIDSIACPSVGLCVAVGMRSAPHLRPEGFYSVLRDGRWSRLVGLADTGKRSLQVFCRAASGRCLIPLGVRTSLTSRTWSTVSPRDPALALPAGLPELGSVSVRGPGTAPSLALSVRAGSGRIAYLAVAFPSDQVTFADTVDPGAITVTSGRRRLAYTSPDGSGLRLTFPHPAAMLRLKVVPPESVGGTAINSPLGKTVFVTVTISTTNGTFWTLTRLVRVS